MDCDILAGLVKRAYPSFNMDSFENRLKIQKFVFLLKNALSDLGYHFNLYLRGPYSPELARDAFQISDWSEIKEIRFKEEEKETKFKKFLAFLEPFKEDTKWLEIASTIVLMKEALQTDNKNFIIKEVKKTKSDFAPEYITNIYHTLKEEGLI